MYSFLKIHRNPYKKIGWIVFGGILAVFGIVCVQAFYFFCIMRENPSPIRAQAIIVFNGSLPRVKAAYSLANQNLAENLVISPASTKNLEKYDKQYRRSETLKHIVEPKARTTFENALLCSEIIKRKGWKNIILVTHSQHMPRSYFLLRCMLLGQGVRIQRYQATQNYLPGIELTRTIEIKIFYNEMLDTWGSMGEWGVYKIRGAPARKGQSRPAMAAAFKSDYRI